jgi:hypothetical protein
MDGGCHNNDVPQHRAECRSEGCLVSLYRATIVMDDSGAFASKPAS